MTFVYNFSNAIQTKPIQLFDNKNENGFSALRMHQQTYFSIDNF